MAMTTAFKNLILDYGAALITHIGLVDETGTELSGGSYARQPITWTSASNGVVRPVSDLSFSIPAGTTVSGWRGYTALSGGTNYGGASLTPETFSGQGEYILLASGTGISASDV
jgi:hypothetical protein